MSKKDGRGFKPAKNYEPNRNSGSSSPKHRGHRPEEAPRKDRWNADERSARSSDSGAGRGYDRDARPARDDRGGYQARPAREDRGGYQGRPASRDDRGGYQARPAREDRGGYQGRPASRDDRGGYQARPARDDRGGYQGRPAREDRGGYQGRPASRDDRGGYQGRPAARDDRGGYQAGGDRPQRRYFDEAGAERRGGSQDAPRRDYNSDRPARDFNSDRPRRESGSDRPNRDSAPRREFNNDRPKRDFGSDRPRRDFGADRPSRDSAPRRDFNSDRPTRDFSDRPRRDYTNDRPATTGHVNRENRTGGFMPAEDVVLERLKGKQILAEDAAGKTFGDLGLGDNIVRVLSDLGAAAPFPIQAATIPDVLSGRDVLGRGRTGSGKTIAFGAPLVERLLKMKAEGAFDNDPPRERPERPQRGERPTHRRRTPGRKPKAIILAPTRELALQIDRTVQPIARSVGLFTTQVYGGVPQARQVGALERGVDIIIGTPGRIEDLIRQGHLDLREVVIAVLDEADHMCDLGFLEPVQRILRSTAHASQKLLFSATLDQGVAKLVNEFLEDPAVHEVAGEDQASGTIDHQVIIVNREDKLEVLRQLGDRNDKTVIFTRTRAYAEQLTEMFEDVGISAVALHGDLNQARRTRNLERLTSGRARVLVATDVAARGIHVDDVSLIIQADAPDDYKTYMHRAGRTGRAGKSGSVLTIIPRNRQRRTSELLERAEITPTFFSDFYPGDSLPGPTFAQVPAASTEAPVKKAAKKASAPVAAAPVVEAEVEIVSATFIANAPEAERPVDTQMDLTDEGTSNV